MSHGRKREGANLEFDSFMDVVTNMVGILIIFVVIFGARSREVTAKAATATKQEAAEAAARKPDATALRVGADVERLEQQIAEYNRELATRHAERGAMLTMLSTLETQWDEKKQQLEASEQEAARLAGERRQLISAIHDLELASQTKRELPPEIVALEHLPTPMAQTVFGEEVHFRLKGGRITVVPLEALIEAIKEDFQRMMNNSVREGVREGMVGPLRDFTAHYGVSTERGTVQRGGQVASALRMELVGLVLEPVREPLGETLEEALQPHSQLAYELAGRVPRNTTITVWVYPDSFAEFRRLKEHLYGLGYATAARPLPEGQPISGSPQGSRSTAQ